MYCTRCGIELGTDARFCQACGTATEPNARKEVVLLPQYPRLSRPAYDKKIAGVCAGFARYLGVDVTLVRVLWLVFAFVPFPAGLIAYLIGWIVMPRDPLQLPESTTALQTNVGSSVRPANGTV